MKKSLIGIVAKHNGSRVCALVVHYGHLPRWSCHVARPRDHYLDNFEMADTQETSKAAETIRRTDFQYLMFYSRICRISAQREFVLRLLPRSNPTATE
jgi:hypothetical protein